MTSEKLCDDFGKIFQARSRFLVSSFGSDRIGVSTTARAARVSAPRKHDFQDSNASRKSWKAAQNNALKTNMPPTKYRNARKRA